MSNVSIEKNHTVTRFPLQSNRDGRKFNKPSRSRAPHKRYDAVSLYREERA